MSNRHTRRLIFAVGTGIVGLLATLLLAPSAWAGWATEDASTQVAQIDTTCHDGIEFDWADDQVLYVAYKFGAYTPAGELAKQQQWVRAGTSQAYLYVPGVFDVAVKSGDLVLPWNPTRIPGLEFIPNTDSGQIGIHLLEGHISWTYGWLPSRTPLALSHHQNHDTYIGIGTTVTDCYLHAGVTVVRQTATTVQVALHGTSHLGVGSLAPSTFSVRRVGQLSTGGPAPSSSSIRDVDGDGWSDLVMTFSRPPGSAPLALTGQTATGNLLTGPVR